MSQNTVYSPETPKFDFEQNLGPETRPQYGEPADPLAGYLRDIGNIPLLDKDEERELSHFIQAGLSAHQELLMTQNPDDQRLAELETTIGNGKEAARRFVNANLRLVVMVAKKYQGSGMPLLDLIQEGNLGLMHAVEKFDGEKGFRFSTYGVWWIKQTILKGIAASGHAVRLPTRTADERLRLLAAINHYENEGHGSPAIQELAEEASLSVESARALLPFMSAAASLNQTATPDSERELGDTLESVDTDSVEESVMRSDTAGIIVSLLHQYLDRRERSVIALRYGFEDGIPHEIKQIAETLNISNERVRQLETRGLTKLRHPAVVAKHGNLR